MAVEQYHGLAVQQRTDGSLALAFGTEVLVLVSGTVDVADIYEDSDGATPKANPFLVNATYATIDFFARFGQYHIELSKPGYDFPDDLTHITIGTEHLRLSVSVEVDIAPGATVMAEDIIPVGARVVSVTVENTVGPGVTNGLTSYDIGDGAVADKWGHHIEVTEGHRTTQADFTSSDLTIYPNAGDVVLSAIGGTFDATGMCTITVEYEPA